MKCSLSLSVLTAGSDFFTRSYFEVRMLFQPVLSTGSGIAKCRLSLSVLAAGLDFKETRSCEPCLCSSRYSRQDQA